MSVAIDLVAFAKENLILGWRAQRVIQAVRRGKFKSGGQSGLGCHVGFP